MMLGEEQFLGVFFMVICIFAETTNFVLAAGLASGITVVVVIPVLSDPPVTGFPSHGPVGFLEVHPLHP